MAIVEPFGEDRADTREKLNTLADHISRQSPAEFEDVYKSLDNYTGDDANDPDQMEVNEAALKAIKHGR